jgi:hypothetical protein
MWFVPGNEPGTPVFAVRIFDRQTTKAVITFE